MWRWPRYGCDTLGFLVPAGGPGRPHRSAGLGHPAQVFEGRNCDAGVERGPSGPRYFCLLLQGRFKGKKKGSGEEPPEPLLYLERKTGFEPATPTLARLCSTPELLPQNNLPGGGTQNRTGDTRIFSPLLYHLSYPAS